MTIRSESILAKIFYFSEAIKSNFHGWAHWKETKPDTTNLCYFMRSILVYLPFMLAMHVLAFGSVIVALFVYPIIRAGGDWWHIPGFVLGCIGVIIAVIGIVLGISFVYEKIKRKKPPVTRIESEINYRESWRYMLGEWLHAIHENICPFISIKKD